MIFRIRLRCDAHPMTCTWCEWVSFWVHHSGRGYGTVCSLGGRRLGWKNTWSSNVMQPALAPCSVSVMKLRLGLL